MRMPSEDVRLTTAAASHLSTAADEEHSKTRRKRFLRRCCIGSAALTVINVIVTVILMLTVFKPKDTVFRLNKVTVVKIDLINGTNTPRPGSNVTLNIDASLKNPNFISFKHPSATSTVYYRGVVIGEARMPPGTQKARRSTRMNVTMEVISDRILSVPGLDSDMKSGLFTASGYSKVRGTAKFFFVSMHVKVKLNCTGTVNVTSLEVLHQKCKKKFKL